MIKQYYVIKYFGFTGGDETLVYCYASSPIAALNWFNSQYLSDVCEFISIAQIFVSEVE